MNQTVPARQAILANPSVGTASAAVILSAALWGLFWVPLRSFEASGVDGEWALFLLYFPGFVLLFGIVAWDFRRQRPHLKAALLVGFFVGLALACFGVGILHTTVVRSTLLFYLTPIWGTLIGVLWLGERFSWKRWVAIGLGTAGLLALISGKSGGAQMTGDLLSLLAGVFWAIGSAIIKKSGQIPIAGMSMVQFFWAAVLSLLIGSLLSPLSPLDLGDFRVAAVAMLLVSLVLVVPAVFMLFWASQHLYPGRVGLLMMSEALVALVTASIFLPEETLDALQWVGAFLIVTASFVELRATEET